MGLFEDSVKLRSTVKLVLATCDSTLRAM